jgi:hypothetical protein
VKRAATEEDMTPKKLAELRLELVEATRLSFDECRRKCADQTIYAYALVVCSRGGEALQPWCHTEESFAKKEAKWPGRADEAGLRRYCPDEWWSIVSGPIKTRRGRDWDEIQDDLIGLYEERYEDRPDVVWEVLIEALESLDREGYFGSGPAREAVTLMVYQCDSGGEWWPDSVRRLNPPAVWKRFQDAVS